MKPLLTEQIFGQIGRLRSRETYRSKNGIHFCPRLSFPGDGMKAHGRGRRPRRPVSPLRRVLRTFSGLYTAKGESGQKRCPYKFTACPFRSKPFSLFIILSKRCITPKYTKGAFGPAEICRMPKQTVKKKNPFIRSVEAPGRQISRQIGRLRSREMYRSKNGIHFCPLFFRR